MAWVTIHPIHKTFKSLFVHNGDTFTINDDCLSILEEILRNLSQENCTLRTFRRAIGFGQNIRKNITPLLHYFKDNSDVPNATKIIDTTIEILVNLTIPVEYLLPVDALSCTEVGRRTVFELNKLLNTSKEVFMDCRNIKAIVDHMKYMVESDSQMDVRQCSSINNCLLLLRNILHIPENKSVAPTGQMTHSSMQNQIIWNLFTQSIDKIIIYLMTCPQKAHWSITMVQLIALMYKDQHVGTLQKLLNLWLESSYSESSEDNESNTSPPPDQGSEDMSPVITSTSDSSDTGGNDLRNSANNKNNSAEVVRASSNRSKPLAIMKRNKSTETESSSGISSMGQSTESNEKLSISPSSPTPPTSAKKTASTYPSSQSETSDCGYGTQVENQESISTSSNDDDQPRQKPVHQKPHTFQKTRLYTSGKNRATTALEKKELRRKKLVKRSKTHTINIKGLMHHLPTDEDVSNILKEFTVDFLLKGYGTLVQDLHAQLLTNVHVQIDTSHFFWLVTYFLKFATQLELDPEHINPVLSYEILSYLVFQGIWIYEELEISSLIPDVDLKPCLRRLHLVVTAIREFLQGLETYQKMIHLSDSDSYSLNELQVQITETEDLKMLFILLLRQYNPSIQSRQYLQDLILTNHNVLLFLDSNSRKEGGCFDMVEHLKQFASVEIMRQYGTLLESFKENGEFVNNCIFTMMHHVGGDLKNLTTLFQPSILKTFSQIWETDYEICDDWSDLIEYVIHKFMNSPTKHCPQAAIENVQEENLDFMDNLSHSEWTREEKDNLLKYYNQSKSSSDAIKTIMEKYEKGGTRHKTPSSVIRELLEQNIISDSEYEELMRYNNNERSDSLPEEKVSHRAFQEETVTHLDSDVKVLKEYLYKENKGSYIAWLQSLLMEACFVKLVLNSPDEFKRDTIVEPIVYYYSMLNLPIPLVPWTVEHASILKQQPFVLLLHKLGFHLPADTGQIFVRVPNFWTAEHMFNIARQLGPIDPEKLKFDINVLEGKSNCDASGTKSSRSNSLNGSAKFSMIDLKQTPNMVRYTPLNNQLSIAIPNAQTGSCSLPPPELTVAKISEPPTRNVECSLSNAECSPVHETDILLDDLERNSNCDTASVASDLTRMCVSDEEEKVTSVLKKNKQKCVICVCDVRS